MIDLYKTFLSWYYPRGFPCEITLIVWGIWFFCCYFYSAYNRLEETEMAKWVFIIGAMTGALVGLLFPLVLPLVGVFFVLQKLYGAIGMFGAANRDRNRHKRFIKQQVEAKMKEMGL